MPWPLVRGKLRNLGQECPRYSHPKVQSRVHEQPFHFRAILLDVAQGLLFRLQIQRIQRVNVAHGCIGGLLVSPVAEMAPT